MNRWASFPLLVLAATPGCGLTRSVWTRVREEAYAVQSVRLSPGGDACVIYEALILTPAPSIGPFKPGGGLGKNWAPYAGGEEGFVRRVCALVIPADELEKLVAAAPGEAIVEVAEGDLRRFVHPDDPASESDFALRQGPVPGLEQWRTMPTECCRTLTCLSYPCHAPAFRWTRPCEGHSAAGSPTEALVRLHLPTRRGLARKPSVLTRIALTPLALAGDMACDVLFLIVVAPVTPRP